MHLSAWSAMLAGPEALAEWRKNDGKGRKAEELRVRGNLDGVNLDEMDLHGFDFDGAQMRGVSLMGTNLHGANLAGIDLSGAQMMDARFDGADLSEANLSGVVVNRDVSFVGADLSSVVLWKARIKRSNFTRARMGGAYLVRASFFLCEFDETELDGTLLDPTFWVASLVRHWDEGGPVGQKRLIDLIRGGERLTTGSIVGAGRPHAILTGETAPVSDAFTQAWETGGISPMNLLLTLYAERTDWFSRRGIEPTLVAG